MFLRTITIKGITRIYFYESFINLRQCFNHIDELEHHKKKIRGEI